jgi:hypothetical protein
MSTQTQERVPGAAATQGVEYPPLRGVNWRAVQGIIRKDLRVVLQSKSVTIPMIIVPLIMVVLIPLGMALALSYFGERVMGSSDFAEILSMVPESMRGGAEGDSAFQVAALFVLRNFFAPLYLIVPIMTSSVIAADAFAGERERKTLEALLYTPTTDFDLVVSKMLGALIPAVVIAWVSALLYWSVVNIAAWPLFERMILPNGLWLLLAFWVAPAGAAASLGATVLVSARAKSFQDAQQISGLLVLPVVLLMLSQSMGALVLGPQVTFLIGAAFWLLAAVFYVIATRTLRRQEMIARL